LRFNFKILLFLYVFIGFSISKAGAFDDFFKAIVFDQVPLVGNLIYRGMDPNTPTEKGEPALVFAVRSGAPKSVAFLLKQPGIQVDATNTADETALMLAAIANDLVSANLLIEAGASINRPNWTPLHYAASKGHTAMMRLLIDNDAYIDAESPNGTTPLMMAAYYASHMAVKLMLEEGADPNLQNQDGQTALDMALSKDKPLSAQYIRVFKEALEAKEGQ
jgi:ankyrin repeat protein